MGLGASLPSTSPAAPAGKVASLSLLHPPFSCGVEGDGGTSSHIGGVDQGEGTYIRDGHPELEAHEGDSLMSEGLWAEGALQ